MKNLIIKNYHLKKCSYLSIDDGKGGKGDENISDEQYSHWKNVWNEFDFNTFRDFHNHYLKKDVLLLADVFEKFISTSLKYYNLDPCHYFSATGLSWDAKLKITKVELEKLAILIYIFLLKKEWEGVLVILIEDIVKQTRNIVQIMIKINLKNILLTLT